VAGGKVKTKTARRMFFRSLLFPDSFENQFKGVNPETKANAPLLQNHSTFSVFVFILPISNKKGCTTPFGEVQPFFYSSKWINAGL
jgi:hypothetical protein